MFKSTTIKILSNELIYRARRYFFELSATTSVVLFFPLLDAAVPKQLSFQMEASPNMLGIVAFHNDLSFVLAVVSGFTLVILLRMILLFSVANTVSDEETNTISLKTGIRPFQHHTALEVVWTSIPIVILLLVAGPSLSLLYSSDELIDPRITVKIIGHQWYWSYEMSDAVRFSSSPSNASEFFDMVANDAETPTITDEQAEFLNQVIWALLPRDRNLYNEDIKVLNAELHAKIKEIVRLSIIEYIEGRLSPEQLEELAVIFYTEARAVWSLRSTYMDDQVWEDIKDYITKYFALARKQCNHNTETASANDFAALNAKSIEHEKMYIEMFKKCIKEGDNTLKEPRDSLSKQKEESPRKQRCETQCYADHAVPAPKEDLAVIVNKYSLAEAMRADSHRILSSYLSHLSSCYSTSSSCELMKPESLQELSLGIYKHYSNLESEFSRLVSDLIKFSHEEICASMGNKLIESGLTLDEISSIVSIAHAKALEQDIEVRCPSFYSNDRYILWASADSSDSQAPLVPLEYETSETVIPTLIDTTLPSDEWTWGETADLSGLDYTFDAYMVPESDLELGQIRLLETTKSLIVPTDTQIRFLVTSADVLHSWAVPSLGIKIDACPGRLNQVGTRVFRRGVFYGQCSEICGINHGFMPIQVEAIGLPSFRQYYAENYVVPGVLPSAN